jgi:hypothetical protein
MRCVSFEVGINYKSTLSLVLLKKLVVLQLGNKFPHFMGPNYILMGSQEPATCICSEPDYARKCIFILFS